MMPVNPTEEDDYKELLEQDRDNHKLYLDPKPVSEAEQKQLDLQEEEENKKREHEARLAQKKLEQQKAKEAFEKQQQIIK